MRSSFRLACAALVATASLPSAAQFSLGSLLQGVANQAAAGAANAAAAAAVQGALAPAQGASAPAGAAEAPAPTRVATAEELQAILQAPPAAMEPPATKGSMALKGKRFYLAEYRVLFEVGGKVTANTRAAYFGGVDRGATRMTVTYSVPKVDVALLQAITDRAYADFVAQLAAAGLQPEPAEAFVKENGAVYEATVDATRPGAEVHEEVDLGYGSRKYMVFTPAGTKMVSRGFAGIGAGNIGKRIDFSKSNLEGVSVGIAVNLAAQESSGGGSSLFKRGSSANASAAMEVLMPPKQAGVAQSHARSEVVALPGAMPVPGQFASFREVGGYDSSKDAAVRGIQMLGALTMGVAGNNSKRVDMEIDVDNGALARQVLQGVTAVHKATVAGIN
jgi:hypothetical protein